MSGIKAIDKLNNWIDGIALSNPCLFDNGDCKRLREIADEIEAEIAERFAVLPVDADGITISVGDVVQGLGNSGPVQHLELWDGRWVVVFEYEPGQFTRYSGEGVHHVKPRTLEDVLWSFADKWRSFAPEDFDGVYPNEVIDECAEEIRAMFGELDR